MILFEDSYNIFFLMYLKFRTTYATFSFDLGIYVDI